MYLIHRIQKFVCHSFGWQVSASSEKIQTSDACKGQSQSQQSCWGWCWAARIALDTTSSLVRWASKQSPSYCSREVLRFIHFLYTECR
jgi:hypothetical protein